MTHHSTSVEPIITTVYTLRKLNDQGGILDVVKVRQAEPQPWTAPVKKPSRVTAYSYRGQGTRRFSMTSPLPELAVTATSSRTISPEGGKQSQKIALQIRLQVSATRGSRQARPRPDEDPRPRARSRR